MTLQQQIDHALDNEQPLDLRFGTYTIDEPLIIAPRKGSQQRLNIRADNVKLIWAGAENSPMIYAKGWKNSTIQGLHLDTGNVQGVTAWDLDTPDDAPSISGLVFTNCQVNFGSGGGCIGWRGSHGGNLYGDVSALLFQGCMLRGLSRSNGDIAWQALRRNNLAWTWMSGGASRLGSIFSNRNPHGGAQHGGGSMIWYGLVATENECDFDLYAPGVFLISGGRFETGKRFLSLGAGGASFGAAVTLEAVNVASYTSDDGVVFYLGTAGSLALNNCSINRFGGADYTAAMITANAAAGGHGAIRIAGGNIQVTSPPYMSTSGQWAISVQNVSKVNAASSAVGYITG